MGRDRFLRIVKAVRETDPPGKALLVDFEDSPISFQIPKKFLKRWRVENLSPGDVIMITSRKGKDDVDLFGFNTITNIQKM